MARTSTRKRTTTGTSRTKTRRQTTSTEDSTTYEAPSYNEEKTVDTIDVVATTSSDGVHLCLQRLNKTSSTSSMLLNARFAIGSFVSGQSLSAGCSSGE